MDKKELNILKLKRDEAEAAFEIAVDAVCYAAHAEDIACDKYNDAYYDYEEAKEQMEKRNV